MSYTRLFTWSSAADLNLRLLLLLLLAENHCRLTFADNILKTYAQDERKGNRAMLCVI